MTWNDFDRDTRPYAATRDDTLPPAGFSLTQADVAEFRALLERECGVALDETEAWNRATELVALFRMLLGPIPEDPALEAGSNVVAVASLAPGKLR